MTVPSKLSNLAVPVKYYLASYRALSDGRAGIRQLEKSISEPDFLVSDWKIIWIGTCAVLRTSIDLFRIDSRSCIVKNIRKEIEVEWRDIKENYENHQIFWKFLREERDSIIHQYEWRAYETWIKPDGSTRPRLSWITMGSDDGAKLSLLMKSGAYKGKDSLELLKIAAEWVEERIFAAITRAGYSPDEIAKVGELASVNVTGGMLSTRFDD